MDVDSDDIPRRGDAQLIGAREIDWGALAGAGDYPFADLVRTSDRLPYRLFAELILGCKWFTRTWTVQELVCSKT